MAMTEQLLARALVQKGLLTPNQVQHAAQKRTAQHNFAQVVVELGWVSTMDVLEIDPHAFEKVPAAPANGAPSNGAATNGAGNGAAPGYAPPGAAAGHAPSTADVGLGQDASPDFDESGVQFAGDFATDDDAVLGTIVQYCNELLRFAVQMRASDLHLEPREGSLLPRYRVDGHLRTYGNPIPGELQAPIISRFKVLSNIDITENRLPQDGRFRAFIGGRTYDFRVSTLPSIHGEKIVMRILDRTALVTDLTKLGFSPEDRERFEEMLGRSYGLILVTGPTGSGKTTTLYAALSATLDETKNVITVEDPVEYELPGVTQTNVLSDIGLTFATQLRAILRQDPDVILVGEIRDNETADIAVRAALTGHLVLSTLHTNSAAAAVARLQDMDVPDFLLASSISGVLAQRLVRLICRNCRQPVDQSTTQYDIDITRLRLPRGTVIYQGAGCEECNGTGSRGRMALIELLNVDSDMRRAIMNKAPADQLRNIAIKSGMKTLWQDGLEKVKNGLTTADEVARALLGADEGAANLTEQA
jgi:type II secretory ATPase GspE/PulE/Tfp pilus assembly ATPase PilB-like protein